MTTSEHDLVPRGDRRRRARLDRHALSPPGERSAASAAIASASCAASGATSTAPSRGAAGLFARLGRGERRARRCSRRRASPRRDRARRRSRRATCSCSACARRRRQARRHPRRRHRRFVHAMEGAAARRGRRSSPWWRRRIAGAFRFPRSDATDGHACTRRRWRRRRRRCCPPASSLLGATLTGAAIGSRSARSPAPSSTRRCSAPSGQPDAAEGPRLAEPARHGLDRGRADPARLRPRARSAARSSGRPTSRRRSTTQSGGGGKGGVGRGGAGDHHASEYRYLRQLRRRALRGPISGIGRVWADGKRARSLAASPAALYPGSETQEPDSLIVASEGAATRRPIAASPMSCSSGCRSPTSATACRSSPSRCSAPSTAFESRWCAPSR